MKEHADSVAEMLSYLQLMGGSSWRTSETCSWGDNRVCNSAKTKHKISTALVKHRWLACLAGGNGETHLKMENTSPDEASSLLPQLDITWGYFSFHCWSSPIPSPTHSFSFILVQLYIKEKTEAWIQFLQHWGWSPAAQCSTTSRPPVPSHCPCTTALHFSTETTGFWKTHSSRLLPFRGSLATYKISPFSMQTVKVTLTLQSLQQQILCHCKSIKFSESV